jgi:thiol-disulfide isomerase/thioredoxin
VRRAWAALLVAGLLAAGCGGDDPEPGPGPGPAPSAAALPDCPAPGPPSTSPAALPDLELPCLDGGPGLPLRRLTGTPTVLNLWASWCPPCLEELPAFARLEQDAGSRVRVVGVASRDDRDGAVSFAAGGRQPFPSLEDRGGELGRALRRNALPVTVFVRADGSVAEAYLGRPLTDATLRAKVRTLLGVDV